MAKTIRALSIIVNSRKIAECESATWEVTTGDEAHVGTEGYIGHSDGAGMTKCTTNNIIPVTGMEVRLKDLIRNREYCTVSAIVDGDAESVEGRWTGRNYSSDAKTGALKGAFSFEGGEPVY